MWGVIESCIIGTMILITLNRMSSRLDVDGIGEEASCFSLLTDVPPGMVRAPVSDPDPSPNLDANAGSDPDTDADPD
jgi:hypothetical protein